MYEFILGNLKESQALADAFKGEIHPNSCYDNIAKIVLDLPQLDKVYPGVQVSYGGAQVFPEDSNNSIYAKHIFFVHDGKAFDPTFAVQGKLKKETKFLPLLTFKLEDYRKLLSEYRETSPTHILNKIDVIGLELIKENIILVG